MVSKLIGALGAFALLAACEMKAGTDDKAAEAAPKGGQAAQEPAAGKAEEGKFSIKGPGFDMKLAIPKDLADKVGSDGKNDLLYPGSSIAGMHVEAAKPSSGVEIRFATPDAPSKVAGWYRDPARASGFEVASAQQDGEAITISGRQKSDGDPFSVQLSPAAGGGTDGRLTLSDRK